MRPGELVHLLVEDLDLETGWVHVRNKPELGWRIKTRRDRMIPLSLEAVGVLRKVLGSRGSGPVICRRRFTGTESPAVVGTRSDLAAEYQRRLTAESSRTGLAISRTEQARIARRLWVDAGATDAEQIRASFIRTAKTIGIDATCPKSWRHTFATLLQDANVDPLIRQLTLGHRHGPSAAGGLGMTAVYTHTRPETQAREIKRALELWPQSLEYGRQWHAGSV
jgi:integrase